MTIIFVITVFFLFLLRVSTILVNKDDDKQVEILEKANMWPHGQTYLAL